LTSAEERRYEQVLEQAAWFGVTQAISLDKGRPFVEVLAQDRDVDELQAAARAVLPALRAGMAGASRSLPFARLVEELTPDSERWFSGMVAVELDSMGGGRFGVWPSLFGPIRWSEARTRQIAPFPHDQELVDRWTAAIRLSIPTDNWEAVRRASNRIRQTVWG
jgi:hypothetical protein